MEAEALRLLVRHGTGVVEMQGPRVGEALTQVGDDCTLCSVFCRDFTELSAADWRRRSPERGGRGGGREAEGSYTHAPPPPGLKLPPPPELQDPELYAYGPLQTVFPFHFMSTSSIV